MKRRSQKLNKKSPTLMRKKVSPIRVRRNSANKKYIKKGGNDIVQESTEENIVQELIKTATNSDGSITLDSNLLNNEIIKKRLENKVINTNQISLTCFSINLGERTEQNEKIENNFNDKLENAMNKISTNLGYFKTFAPSMLSYPTIIFIGIQKKYNNNIELFTKFFEKINYKLINEKSDDDLQLINLLFLYEKFTSEIIINNTKKTVNIKIDIKINNIVNKSHKFSENRNRGDKYKHTPGVLITQLSISDTNNQQIPFTFININLPSLNGDITTKNIYLQNLSKYLLDPNNNFNLYNNNMILLGSFNYNNTLEDNKKLKITNYGNTNQYVDIEEFEKNNINNSCSMEQLFKDLNIDTNKLKKELQTINKRNGLESLIQNLTFRTLKKGSFSPILRNLYNKWLEKEGYLVPQKNDKLLEQPLIKNLFMENPITYCQTCNLNTNSKYPNTFYEPAKNKVFKYNIPAWCDRIFFSINKRYKNIFKPFIDNSNRGLYVHKKLFNDSTHLGISQLFLIDLDSNKKEENTNINLYDSSSYKNFYDQLKQDKLTKPIEEIIMDNLSSYIYRDSTPKY